MKFFTFYKCVLLHFIVLEWLRMVEIANGRDVTFNLFDVPVFFEGIYKKRLPQSAFSYPSQKMFFVYGKVLFDNSHNKFFFIFQIGQNNIIV